MARGNIGGDDDDEVAQQRHYYWSLKDIPRFEGHEGEQPFLHLMEFEDYLVTSGVSIVLHNLGVCPPLSQVAFSRLGYPTVYRWESTRLTMNPKELQ